MAARGYSSIPSAPRKCIEVAVEQSGTRGGGGGDLLINPQLNAPRMAVNWDCIIM